MCANGHSLRPFWGWWKTWQLGPGPQRSLVTSNYGVFWWRSRIFHHLVSPFAQTVSWPLELSAPWLDRPIKPSLKSIPKFHKIFAIFSQKKMDSRSTMTVLGDSPYTNWSSPALQVRPTNAHPPWQALQWLFCWAAKRGVGVRTVWRFFLVKQPCLCKSNNILRLSVCIWLYFYIQIYKDFFTHTKLIHWNVIYHFFQVKKAEVEGKLVTSLRSCIALETFLDSVVTFQQSAFVRDFLASYSLQGIWLDNVIGKNDT